MWITNGTQADWMCLLANTGDGPAHRNKSLICVPMKRRACLSKRSSTRSACASDTAQIISTRCACRKRNRIGEEGKGFTYQMLQFQEERLWGAAAGLKPMEWIIDETIAYTRQRKIFGKPILDNQTVHFKLAELQTESRDAARADLSRRRGMMIAGKDVTTLATMAKLKAGRLQREVGDGCMQYWGGMGYMNETPVTRFIATAA
jgi:citronellyl-CoA dehydrogenase